MRSLILVVLLAGCQRGNDLDWGSRPGPWRTEVIAATGAGQVVAETRDACGFPDPQTDYRLYRAGVRFAAGNMETDSWQWATTRDATGTTIKLFDQRCVLDDTALTCVPCRDELGPCTPRRVPSGSR